MSRVKLAIPALLVAVTVALGMTLPATAAPLRNSAANAVAAPAAFSAVAKGKLAAAKPTIKGTATVGKKLTVKPGKWTVGTTLKVQWFAAGKKLAGKTGMTLKVTKPMVGKKISVKVTGSKLGYKKVTKKSNATVKVKPAPAVKIVRFKNCTEMHKVYPHGVGRKGAVDSTPGARVTSFFVHNALYEANAGSDRDKDGIACEA